jgi:prepilin-type N-terminal cleavage/methylation domain-containing protein
MDNFCKIRRRGFTLVELLIAMAVGIVIIAAVYSAMNLALRFSANTDRKVISQQDTRAVLDLMAMEIRMASYNPTMSKTVWSTIPSCNQMGLASPVSANKGIQIATANTILIAMDLGGIPNPVTSLNNLPSGIIDDYPNEYIEYSYNGQDTITRNVSCGGNQAILGGTAPDSNVSNAAVLPAPIPLFQYFDRNDQPTALIPNIRRIQITIVTDTAAKDTTQTGTPRPRRMIYSTSVIVRNHALSP